MLIYQFELVLGVQNPVFFWDTMIPDRVCGWGLCHLTGFLGTRVPVGVSGWGWVVWFLGHKGTSEWVGLGHLTGFLGTWVPDRVSEWGWVVWFLGHKGTRE